MVYVQDAKAYVEAEARELRAQLGTASQVLLASAADLHEQQARDADAGMCRGVLLRGLL